MRFILKSLVASASLVCCLSAWAETTVIKKPAPRPNRISTRLMVIGQEVIRDQWPGTLTVVNAPDIRKTALPGQCVSIAVVASGDERDSLLRASTFNFKIEFDGKTRTYEGLHAAQIKRLKPEGGDFVMQVLGAAKVGEVPDMTLASMATFDLGWCVPPDAKDAKASIHGYATLPKGESLRFDKASVPISSFASAVARGKFKDKDEFNQWIMTYHRQPNPARVLAVCRLLAGDNMAFGINIRTFLVEVLKSSPEAAMDLQSRLSGESPQARGYAIYLLRTAGYDVTKLVDRLPEKERDLQNAFQTRIPPLPDPYDLHVDPEHFDTPQRMDALWSIFLVTGKPKPVRAIADLLMWRENYQAVKVARKTPGQHKPLTVELGRGVCYMAAGWSLGSFVRNDGLVADFVDAWKQDASTPKIIKEELDNLLANDAFKRS